MKNNALDEGAVRKEKHDDALRKDTRKHAIIPDEPQPKRSTKSDDAEPTAKKRADDDTPKRTATKTSDLEPQKKKDEAPLPEKTAEKKQDVKLEPAPEKKKDDPPKQAKLDS